MNTRRHRAAKKKLERENFKRRPQLVVLNLSPFIGPMLLAAGVVSVHVEDHAKKGPRYPRISDINWILRPNDISP